MANNRSKIILQVLPPILQLIIGVVDHQLRKNRNKLIFLDVYPKDLQLEFTIDYLMILFITFVIMRNSGIFMVKEDGRIGGDGRRKDVDLNILVRVILFIYKW